MGYGLQTWTADGRLSFDSTQAVLGCLADVIDLPPGTSAHTRTYPVYAGRGVVVMPLAGEPDFGVSADTALGYPRVNLPYSAGRQLLLVFIT